MDILIDLIVMLIKAVAKSRESAAPKPLPHARPAVATPQQIQTVQRTLAAQQARTRPAGKRPGSGPASWAQPGVRAAVPPVQQPPVPALFPAEATIAPPRKAPAGIPGLKVPFLLGEVLSSPVAYREESHGGLTDW